MNLLLFFLVFLLLFILLFILVLGLISPKLVIHWGNKEKRNRKRVLLYYGLGSIVCFSLLIALTPEKTPEERVAYEQKQLEEKREKEEKIAALIESAKSNIDKADYRLARIDLKSALKYDKNSKEVKELLKDIEKKEKDNKIKEKEEKIAALIESAKSNINKTEYKLARTDLESALKYDKNSKEVKELLKDIEKKEANEAVLAMKQQEEKRKAEEAALVALKQQEEKKKAEEQEKLLKESNSNYLQGKQYIENGDLSEGINFLKKVISSDPNYTDAQAEIIIAQKKIEEAAFIAQSIRYEYRELKKNADKFKGENVEIIGKIIHIQEFTNRTLIILSCTDKGRNVWVDDVLVLFDNSMDIYEGDIISVYGNILGKYSTNDKEILNWLGLNEIKFRYNESTNIDLMPVVEGKYIFIEYYY